MDAGTVIIFLAAIIAICLEAILEYKSSKKGK